MKNYLKSKNFILDVIFITFIIGASLFLTSFYFDAPSLSTNYPDWLVHAFRTKMLQEYGFISWTHYWSNGINFWKAYQFVPHLLTLGVTNLFHVSVTQAMVLLTIGAFCFLHLSIYIYLRLLKFSPIPTLCAAFLSFNLAQYWSGVADYSLMFGFIFFPTMIFLWTYFTKGKLIYLYPFLVGISFYIHPLLGFAGIALWGIGVLFSNRAVFSLSTVIQFIIILLGSSLFWLPIAYKPAFLYSGSNLADFTFLSMVLSHYDYYGLSFFILVGLMMSFIRFFFPINRLYPWVKPLTLFLMLYFLLVFIGTQITLPKAISQLQFTRGVTFIGIGASFVIVPILEWFLKKKNLFNYAIVFAIATYIFAEGMYFSSIYSPQPTRYAFQEPISYYLKNTETPVDLSSARVWAPAIDTGSYFPPSTLRLPNSYMGHLEPNQVAPRLGQIITYQPYTDTIPTSNIERVSNYFKLAGVKYIFFEESSPFTNALSSGELRYINLGRLDLPRSIYHMFEVPWNVKNAALIDKQYQSDIQHFPFSLSIEDIGDQTILDNLVAKYANTIYQKNNISLPISYPTQENIEVIIPGERSTNLVYINESYDTDWTAIFNGRKQNITSTGPNFMLVHLDSMKESGVLTLHHSWSWQTYASIIIIISIPIILFINNFIFNNISLQKLIMNFKNVAKKIIRREKR